MARVGGGRCVSDSDGAELNLLLLPSSSWRPAQACGCPQFVKGERIMNGNNGERAGTVRGAGGGG